MWSLVWLLVTYVIVSNAASIVCPNDKDCAVNCTSRYCYNTRVICPGSTTNDSYTCTVVCKEAPCIGLTIESGDTVSLLEIQAVGSKSCENVDIQAEGTEKIVWICDGADACTHSNLTSSGGSSVVLLASNGTNENKIGFVEGNINISHTTNVTLTCSAWGCASSNWIFHNVGNFDLKCFNDSACSSITMAITETPNVTIEAAFDTHSIWGNAITIAEVENFALKVSNGQTSGSFLLLNVKNFLYEDAGESAFEWTVKNVSNVTLSSGDATSFWIVDGITMQKEYKCPNGRDCNIRVDADLSTRNASSLPVICPTDLGKTTATTCRFYCSSVASGCSAIDLKIGDITNAALYFSMNAEGQRPFSVNTNASGLSSANTEINITCNFKSCLDAAFNISGYHYVNIFDTDSWGYSNAIVNVSEFSRATVMSQAQGLQNATLLLTGGDFVNLVAYPGTTSAFLGSNWLFSSIDHVAINCINTIDCNRARFNATKVEAVSMLCGDASNFKSYTSCLNTEVNIIEESSFNLTCTGLNQACMNMQIQYNGSTPDETYFSMNCLLGSEYAGVPNCQNITIDITDNKRGFDAISLYCGVGNYYDACDDVTVSCSSDGIECHCPVTYDDDEENWYCDGPCGTSSCPDDGSSSSSNSSDSDIIYIIVAVAAVVVIIIALVILRRRYAKKQSFQPLLDGSKNNYTH